MLKELTSNNMDELRKINFFLENNKYSEYTQSIEWNLIRNEPQKFYLYCTENNKIMWVCNLLEKERENKKFLYAPRGPVLNYNDSNIIELFFKEIEVWMKKNNYEKIIINPCISYKILENFPNGYNYNIVKYNDYANLLDSCKLAIMKIIFNEEQLIRKLPSKFRQNTRRSYRKNLRFECSKKVDLENFYKLYIETSERHSFKPHDIDYFKNIVSVFKNKLIFLEVWHDNEPLAMSIDIVYNNKLIYLYGVSSTNNRNLLGMYNMQWEAIKYCIHNQIPYYDFGGVFCEENDTENKDYGLYNFKKGYCYDGFVDIVPDITISF